jgi:hypothetical protein
MTATRTVERDGVKVIVRRRTHQGIIIAIAVREALSELYPDTKDLFEQMFVRDIDEMLDSLPLAQRRRFEQMINFAGDCADIVATTGLPYKWPLPGELPSNDWVKQAFTHYMLEGQEGIWRDVEITIVELMKPDGPKETWPEEALSAEDAKDPN